MISYFNNHRREILKAVSDDMLLAAGRVVVSKISAYNITKLSYRVEVRVNSAQ